MLHPIDRRLIEFLKVDISQFTTTYKLNDDEKEGIIVIEIGGKTECFDPFDFCEYMFIGQSEAANEARFNLERQAGIFIELKMYLTNITERFTRYTAQYPNCRKYDFTGFIRQLDAPIALAKFHLDEKLLDSQIKANTSAITTNAHTRKSNVTLIWIFGVTAILSLITALVAILTYRLESTKYEQVQQQKQQLLQEQQKKEKEVKFYIPPHPKHVIDSSKN